MSSRYWTAGQYRASRWLVGLTILILLGSCLAARGAEHVHPAKDMPIHEKFYAKWPRPDMSPTSSCCGKKDCFPTEFKKVGGAWYALKRTWTADDEYDTADRDDPGSWVLVPEGKFEHNLKLPGVLNASGYASREPFDSPDGQNHVCMAQMGAGNEYTGAEPNAPWEVFCAVLGNQM